ncbi:hypothetical protein C2S52_011331 [Perilla frutescens var. hirtella]|nr:hypothetical protein C2S52_011331 [Perilla frutescens var. hirtella]KAH6785989.1 hypothetical protein C2S51_038444 [Perilla frutescens var. frutescens]
MPFPLTANHGCPNLQACRPPEAQRTPANPNDPPICEKSVRNVLISQIASSRSSPFSSRENLRHRSESCPPSPSTSTLNTFPASEYRQLEREERV